MRRATLRKAVTDGQQIISIHALHEESDTEVAIAPDTAATISIHALHEESDRPAARGVGVERDFNPRSPHGERRDAFRHRWCGYNFNPRSP